jgi:hypothetical protein
MFNDFYLKINADNNSHNNSGFLRPLLWRVRLIWELKGICVFILFIIEYATKSNHNLLPYLLRMRLLACGSSIIPVLCGYFNAGTALTFAVDGKRKIIEMIG